MAFMYPMSCVGFVTGQQNFFSVMVLAPGYFKQRDRIDVNLSLQTSFEHVRASEGLLS